MKNMKISKKLMLSFGIVLIFAAIIGGFGIFGLVTVRNGSYALYDAAEPLAELGTAMEYFQIMRSDMWEIVIHTGDQDEINRIEKEYAYYTSGFENNLKSFSGTITTDEARDLYDDIMSRYEKQIKPTFLDVINQGKQGADERALMDYISEADASCDYVTEELDQLFALRDKRMEENNDDNHDVAEAMLTAVVVVLFIALALSAILSMYVSNMISKPLAIFDEWMTLTTRDGNFTWSDDEIPILNQYKDRRDEIGNLFGSYVALCEFLSHHCGDLQEIAGGNIAIDVKIRSEQDQLSQALEKMVHDLNGMFREINEASTQVSAGSAQIADGAQSLASGSTEQAATLQEISASISDISEKTRENAERTENASNLAGIIMQNAEKGSKQMEQMINAVNEINQANQNISKVIKAIDDIAFQTNILALNAAVEAARAGAAGKGFAVVADEVRNLAAKSAESAKETGSLIANSMEKAQLGTQIAGETAASLNDIVSGISESNVIISEIARSSDEQFNGVKQITLAIGEVTQVVQQNSATAEQSAAASEEMSGQAGVLEGLIAQFKLK